MNSSLTKWVAAALFTGLVAVAPVQAQSTNTSDATLADQVKATLLQAPPFQEKGVELKVTAHDGAVNLSGWVTYADDDRLAMRLASQVPGVRSTTANFRSWSSKEGLRM